MDQAFVPIAVLSAEVGDPDGLAEFAETVEATRSERALVLVCLCGEPVGAVEVRCDEVRRTPEALLALVEDDLRAAELRHGHAALSGGSICRWQREIEEIRSTLEPMSVVVCTNGRPDRLRQCLASLADLPDENFELILVDNAPTEDTNRHTLADFEDRLNARYVVEPRKGLSRARNAGLAASSHDIIVFTDDDVVVDRDWLVGHQRGLRLDSKVGVSTGPVLPGEIATLAQDLFERHGGHTKGRGFRRAVFGSGPGEQSPLFPLPPFAVGCNMAFRRSAIEQIGGFDEALGAGTPACAGEDTGAVSEAMLNGWRVAYEPSSVMWHFHRRDLGDLVKQRRSYGIGLGAYYTSLILRDPRRIFPLIGLAPAAIRALAGAGDLGAVEAKDVLTVSSAVDRRAIMHGPRAYLRGRRAAVGHQSV